MSKHLLIVLSNSREGEDDEFNHWYTNVHIPDGLKVDGMLAAQRYQFSSSQLDSDMESPYRYLAVYEVDSPDLELTVDALRDAAQTMETSPALDRDRTVAWFYSPISTRVTSQGE